jgi:non-specific serine/threonine protein kinase/serine/threonine-protein kinase
MEPDRRHIGARIGAYRITDVLGTGGMGDVFRAVRDDAQYEAAVAIKLMRAEVRTQHNEQRFRNERQILAQLDHRNIARLLDGGTTSDGAPYVVMELVEGQAIDGWCEARELRIRDRVQLFLQVCAAVSYAHQHLVVHRDLKPHNILVTADGSVKLLDFGIAKLIEPSATAAESSDATKTQLRAMTLEYASPEQVSGGLVTTVSDVYSLGVVLYRLLTGQSPYSQATDDVSRVAAILSDTSPTRPSQAGELHRRDIDAELDDILLMALRKEPEKRYASVDALAADLRSYLSGLPVLASKDSWRYRLGKFTRRHRYRIAAAGVVLASLIVGVSLAVREARIATAEREVAQHHFDSVRKLANTLLGGIHDEIAKVPGATKAREVLLKTSLEYLDTLANEARSDADLQHELALAYVKVGDIQGSELGPNTGDTKGALESYAKAAALLEAALQANPGDGRIQTLLAKTHLERGRVILVTSGGKEAQPVLYEARRLAEAARSGWIDDRDELRTKGNLYGGIAELEAMLGNHDATLAAVDQMVAVCEAFAAKNPGTVTAYQALTGAYSNAAIIVDPRKSADEQFQRSSALLKKALIADEALTKLDPDSLTFRVSKAESHFNLGDAYYLHGDFAPALEQYRLASPALAERAQDAGDARSQLLSLLNETGLARALFKMNRADEAEVVYKRLVPLLAKLAKDYDNMRVSFAVAQMEVRYGELLAARGDWRQAHPLLVDGAARLQKIVAAVSLDGVNRQLVDDSVTLLAQAESRQ